MSLPATLTTPDGIELFLRHWPAGAGSAGTVQLVHGLGEHIDRHAGLAHALTARGWHVVGHDHRGHGRSTGARGTLRRSEDLLTDLAQVMDAVRATLPGPHVLLGHSLGGLVAATFVAGRQRPVDALVLSSPALDPGLSTFQRVQLAVMQALLPDLRVHNQLPVDRICRDPAVVAAYQADPLVHDRVTARLVQFVVDAAEFTMERAGAWTVPTLLMWAGADRCVRPAGSAQFVERAPASVLSHRRFKGWYHEIFHEPEGHEAVDHLLQWLEDWRTRHVASREATLTA